MPSKCFSIRFRVANQAHCLCLTPPVALLKVRHPVSPLVMQKQQKYYRLQDGWKNFENNFDYKINGNQIKNGIMPKLKLT